MNMQKVETDRCRSTLAGRLFNYGNVTIRGTGSSFATLRLIDSPLKLRTSVTAADKLGPFGGTTVFRI